MARRSRGVSTFHGMTRSAVATMIAAGGGGGGAGITKAFPAHTSAKAYTRGDAVEYGGKFYICDVAIGAKPFAEGDWTPVGSAAGLPGPKGDTGDTGPKGDDGAKGDTGEQGITGPQGIQGTAGAKGDQGEQGVKGDAGTNGQDGDAGAIGPQGPKGDAGVQGPKGDTGANGTVGADGAKGDQGIQGLQGVPGEQGSKGDTGDTGPKGDTGDSHTHDNSPSLDKLNETDGKPTYDGKLIALQEDFVKLTGSTSTGAQLTTKVQADTNVAPQEFITRKFMEDMAVQNAQFRSYSGLIRNGSFGLGDKSNFIGTFSLAKAAKFNSGGSIYTKNQAAIRTKDKIAVSPSGKYELSFQWLVEDFQGAASTLVYCFTAFFDAAGNTITNATGNIRGSSKGLVLTADLNVGDTVIQVDDSSGFMAGSIYNNWIKLPYVSSGGIDYDGTTYSRRWITDNGSTTSDIIDWDNNTPTTIALKRPVKANETALTGQTIWQGNNGGSYVYVAPKEISFASGPAIEIGGGKDVYIGSSSIVYAKCAGRVLNFKWELDGVADKLTPWSPGKMPAGTASVGIGILARYGTESNPYDFECHMSNFNMFQIQA